MFSFVQKRESPRMAGAGKEFPTASSPPTPDSWIAICICVSRESAFVSAHPAVSELELDGASGYVNSAPCRLECPGRPSSQAGRSVVTVWDKKSSRAAAETGVGALIILSFCHSVIRSGRPSGRLCDVCDERRNFHHEREPRAGAVGTVRACFVAGGRALAR